MLALVLYGLLLIGVGLFMIADPDEFVETAINYCKTNYMHPVEISICLLFGAAFAYYSQGTRFPVPFRFFGYLLLTVGGGLVLTPPSLHRKYGIWSVNRVRRLFRPGGVLSVAAGILVLYGTLWK